MAYGNIPIERDPFAADPVGGMRVNPGPMDHLSQVADPQAAMALKMRDEARKRRMAEEANYPTQTITPRGVDESGVDVSKLVGDYTDEQMAAIRKYGGRAARAVPAATATFNGMNYTMPHTNRVTDPKAQRYLTTYEKQKAENMAWDEKTKAADRAYDETRLKLEQHDRDMAKIDRDQMIEAENLKGKRADEEVKRTREGFETDRLRAEGAENVRKLTPAGKSEEEQKDLIKLMMNSGNEKLMQIAAQMTGQRLKIPNLSEAIQPSYEKRRGSVTELLKDFQAANQQGIFTGPNKKNATALKARILQQAHDEGWSPEQIHTLEQEMAGQENNPANDSLGGARRVLGGAGTAMGMASSVAPMLPGLGMVRDFANFLGK